MVAYRAGLTLLGTVLYCGYAMAPNPVLPYFALVPWAILYMDPRRPSVSSLYFLGAGTLGWIGCYGPSFRFGWWAAPVIGLFFVPAWLLFPVLARPIQRLDLPRSITLPVIWVAIEWARLLLAPGHLDFYALGYSQARLTPLTQIADLTGVYGVSFLVAAVNGLVADAFFTMRDAAWRPRILLRERRIVWPGALIAAAFVIAIGYGYVTLARAGDARGPRLAIVQHDAMPQDGADLIVWPAYRIRDAFDGDAAGLEDLARFASQERAPILVEAQSRVDGPAAPTASRVLLVDPEGALRGRYDRQVLLPFRDYVPLDRLAGRVAPSVQRAYRGLVQRLLGPVPHGVAGRTKALFSLSWHGETLPFAALIGVENAYAPLAADVGRRGGRFIVNFTSDDDPGSVFAEQMLRVCTVRAIENRIGYVRVGAGGRSESIDPHGRLLTATVGLGSGGTTPYAASHDAFALLCVALSLWLLARALLRGPATMTPHPVPATASIG